ncbi:unnamed protein product [Rotaria sp. Silwood2]|nr:unnamed protein product [Rotaria sp. Silwood2]CAF3161987.1 unnamed protein product [Rotaria sp. Silwood2]CAF3456957.1 unnamed protein product [Rotaria sp. Silwood2]CAF4505877.1 unnamed protein product [Rotaria sp. Silwood2]CAF4531229.1 unnamed protein product [Rotaria sp. Silwood2]
MGNKLDSKTQLQRRKIGHSQEGIAGEFYWACRNGDIELVKAMLPYIPYDQLNQLEPNGSTPLHAASFFCHADVVRLLLHDYGVQRYYVNRHGLTAYEEAQTEEIKQLFRRPSNRFFDAEETIEDTFDILSVKSNEIGNDNSDSASEDDNEENTNETPSAWIEGYRTKEEIKQEKYYYCKGKALIQSKIGRFIMRNGPKFCSHCRKNKEVMGEFISYFNDRVFRVNKLQAIIDEHVTPEHPEYNKCKQLLSDYLEQEGVDSLLKLYTLETEFYKKIKKSCQAITWSLYIILPDLKERYYQGLSYRGLQMTEKDLQEYRWALKNPDSLIKTKTLSSTSIEREKAEKFACTSDPHQLSVLMIFNFPQVSDMAINLGPIKEKQLPAVSEYEDEKEVLVLPQTFFHVRNIEFDTEKCQYAIYLQNIVLNKSSLIRALKFMIYRDEETKLTAYYTQNRF